VRDQVSDPYKTAAQIGRQKDNEQTDSKQLARFNSLIVSVQVYFSVCSCHSKMLNGIESCYALFLVMRYEYTVAFLHLFIDHPCTAGSLEFAWYFSVCLIPYLPKERSKIFS